MITPRLKAELIAEAGYPPDMLKSCRTIVSFLKTDKQSADDEHALNMAYLLFITHPDFKLYGNHSLQVLANNFTKEYIDEIIDINCTMQLNAYDNKLMQKTADEINTSYKFSSSGKRVLLACLANEFQNLKNNNPSNHPSYPITYVSGRMILAAVLCEQAPDLMRHVDNLAVDVYAKYAPCWARKMNTKTIFFQLAASCLIHQFEKDKKDIDPHEDDIGISLGRVAIQDFVEHPEMENIYPFIDEKEVYLPKRLNHFLQASLAAGQGVDPEQAGFLLRSLVIGANRVNLIQRKTCDAVIRNLIDYICDMGRPQEFQNIFYPRGEMDHAEYYYYAKSISEELQNKILDRLCIEEQVTNQSLPRTTFNSIKRDNNQQRS